jgi:23S rRNA (pseudouridine1915-N3)-methyltransferase
LIKIIAVGKIKESFYRDAINEYLKRLSKYVKIEIVEVEDENITKEKANIIKHIKDKDYLIALDIEGKELDSVSFANKIDILQTSHSNITFIIGGSDGLHKDIKELVKERISFSKLTFPHQLFRIILLEQIYRSYRIINNETYHK